jgi:hypothetical protein
MDGSTAHQLIRESVEAGLYQPFRGEIYEYSAKLDLQHGYAVKGLFDINTARHLIEPLQAIRHSGVRVVSVTAAVQTLKSLIADLCVPYWVEHDPGDTLWLLEDDPKARRYAERALSLLRSVPEIAAMLKGVDRHDATKTEIKLQQMKILMCGLNTGNVQSLSWKNVILDEKWMHAFDGLIRQAMDRTKQYPDTKKIILLGQGGVEDDDADQEHKKTDQRVLHYSCTECGAYQPFELSRQRPENFLVPELRGKYAGLSWDTNDVTRPGGRWDFPKVAKTAHHCCYYCGARILDTPDVRRRLNDSYAYFPAGTADGVKIEAGGRYKKKGELPMPYPFPEAVGFQWPAEASMRVSFAELVVKYLRAKVAAEELAYRLPLQEFIQKDRGETWSDLVEGEHRTIVHEAYDVAKAWPEEAYRPMIVDCQRDLKKFHVSVYAVSLEGESRELERKTVGSWSDLEDIQKKWGVKDQQVFVDCGYQMTAVLRVCVKHGHLGQVRVAGKLRKMWLCWTGIKGSGQELFLHKKAVVNKGTRTELKEFKIFSEDKFYDTNVGTKNRAPRARWFEWSNLHCKDLLRARRDQDAGVPKFLTLPDPLPATDQNSVFAQMRSEARKEEWTPRGKRAIWLLVKETRPNHEWDKGGMLMAFMGKVGIIGGGETMEPATAEKS